MLNQNSNYTIRRAELNDAATIARQRAAMFLDMREVSAEEAETPVSPAARAGA